MRECACSRITNNYICGTCTAELAGYLHRTPWLIRELQTTAARLDKTSSGGNLESKTASKSRPDTVNLNATLAAQELLFLTFKFGGDAGRAAFDPGGPAHYARVKTAYEHGINIIDRKPERIHLGTCPTDGCREPLNVAKGEAAHKCQECGETIDIIAHKKARIGTGLGHVAHPPQIIAFVGKMGHRVTKKDMENWIARKRITKAGDVAGRPVYRIAEVWKIVMERDGVEEKEITGA